MSTNPETKKQQQTVIAFVLGVAILACMIFLLYHQINALKEAREVVEQEPVSYTHLDVYKRQLEHNA